MCLCEALMSSLFSGLVYSLPGALFSFRLYVQRLCEYSSYKDKINYFQHNVHSLQSDCIIRQSQSMGSIHMYLTVLSVVGKVIMQMLFSNVSVSPKKQLCLCEMMFKSCLIDSLWWLLPPSTGTVKIFVRSTYHQEEPQSISIWQPHGTGLFCCVSMTTLCTCTHALEMFYRRGVLLCVHLHAASFGLQAAECYSPTMHRFLSPLVEPVSKAESFLHWNYVSKNGIRFLQPPSLGKSC